MSEAVVYRCYTACGRLMYIGSTINPFSRMDQHSKDKDWWPEIARIDLRHCKSEPYARALEKRAIWLLAPEKNVHGQKDQRERIREGRGLPRLSKKQIKEQNIRSRIQEMNDWYYALPDDERERVDQEFEEMYERMRSLRPSIEIPKF